MNEAFRNSNLTVCCKDDEFRVLWQSPGCQEICGNVEGQVCQQTCLQPGGGTPITCKQLFNQGRDSGVAQRWTQLYRNQVFNGKSYDVVFVYDGKHLFTIFNDVEEKHRAEFEHFKRYPLTDREFEVVKLLIRGYSNDGMVKELGVAKSTLRTHLNKIYKKVPQELFGAKRKGGVK